MQFLRARFSEASTWAALSVPLATLATQIPAPWSFYCYAGAALCGMVAVVVKG
jgi:hypothetical protein